MPVQVITAAPAIDAGEFASAEHRHPVPTPQPRPANLPTPTVGATFSPAQISTQLSTIAGRVNELLSKLTDAGVLHP